MRKQKVYLETTVFNHYFEPTRDEHKATVKLFEEIKQGKFDAFTSDLVFREIKKTPDETKRTKMLKLIEEYQIPVLGIPEEAKALSSLYIGDGIIPEDYRDDALHIAIACMNELDVIISMNFQHINKMKTKTMVAHMNAKYGYTKPIEIYSSREVVDNE